MKNKHLIRCILIVLLGTIAFSSVATVPRFGKGIRTLYQLLMISKNVECLEENASLAKLGENWTDDRIAAYEELMEERNAIYNSSDSFVSKFSLSSNFTQFIILTGLFIVIAIQFCALLLFLFMLAQYVAYFRRKIKRAKARKGKHAKAHKGN